MNKTGVEAFFLFYIHSSVAGSRLNLRSSVAYLALFVFLFLAFYGILTRTVVLSVWLQFLNGSDKNEISTQRPQDEIIYSVTLTPIGAAVALPPRPPRPRKLAFFFLPHTHTLYLLHEIVCSGTLTGPFFFHPKHDVFQLHIRVQEPTL